MEERPIYGIYYCSCVGDYLRIVEEQLSALCYKINGSLSLYEKTKTILFFVCEYNKNNKKK